MVDGVIYEVIVNGFIMIVFFIFVLVSGGNFGDIVFINVVVVKDGNWSFVFFIIVKILDS